MTQTTEVEKFLAGLNRKVEVSDVTLALIEDATYWANSYQGTFEFMLDMKARAKVQHLTAAQAKGVLNCWRADVLRAAKSVTPSSKEAQSLEVGIYVDDTDNSIWKVQENKAKTGKYVKVWTAINGERLTLADTHVNGEWEYVAGGITQVVGKRRMNLDEAKQFILIYGKCVRCGRTLKAAQSVEQGIGPVCINYFGSFGS